MSPSVLHAGTHVWAGGTYLWSKPGNWSSGGAPQVGEAAPVVIVLPPAGAKFSTNDIPGLKIDRLVFSGNNYQVGVLGNASLDFRGDSRAAVNGSGIFLTNVSATVRGPVVFNNECEVHGPGSTLVLNGAVSGTGNCTVAIAQLELTGSQDNSFSGALRQTAGELRLNKTNAVAVAGALHVGANSNSQPNAIVTRLMRPDQLANTVDVTVNADGLVDLNGQSDAVRDLFFNGGRVVTGAGTLTLRGQVKVFAHAAQARLEGLVSVGLGLRTIDVEDGPALEDLQVKAVVSGVASLTKQGAGLLTLSGNNTFSSTLTIAEGQVLAQSTTALGATLLPTVVKPGGTLILLPQVYAAEPLHLAGGGAAGQGALHAAQGNTKWTGAVVLDADAKVVAPEGASLEIAGVVSGPGGLECAGGGDLWFSGSTPNTHTGTTSVREGTLHLNKAINVPALAGPLVVGDGLGGYSADRVLLHARGQIPDGTAVRVNGTGELDMQTYPVVPGALALSATSVVRLQSGSVLVLPPLVKILPNGFTQNGGFFQPGRITGTGIVSLDQPTTVDADPDPTTGLFTVESQLTGSALASLTKVGAGEFELAGDHTYAGETIVQEGTLIAAGSTALGGKSVGTIVKGQGRLWVNGTIGEEPVTIASDPNQPPAWNLGGSFGALAGPLNLQSEARVAFTGIEPTLTLAGPVSGPAGLFVVEPPANFSAGTLRMVGNGANSYAGLTWVQTGILDLNKAGGPAVPGPLQIGDGVGAISSAAVFLRAPQQIADAAPVTLLADGGLDLNHFPETIGSLAGNGRVFCQTAALEFGGNHVDTEWAGGVLGNGQVSLIKSGNGTFRVLSDNFYSGATLVKGGTLEVRGTIADSAVQAQSGHVAGNGGVGSVQIGGGARISPGLGNGGSPDRVLASGSVNLVAGSSARFGVDPTAGDQLAVHGTVNLGGAQLELIVGSAIPSGTAFVLIQNDGTDPVVGTFAGLADQSEWVVANQRFRIQYTGGDGNDVVVTRVNTPPQLKNLTATAFVPEGGSVHLDGQIEDPDATDSFKLLVNWGDGSASETIEFAAGTSFFHVQHFYADDPAGAQASDSVTITYELTDSAGSPALGNLATVVGNVEPSFPSFGAVAVAPGQALTTTLTFQDPGADTWTATVDYGDGSGEQPLTVSEGKALALQHTFASEGVYPVKLSVQDDDTGRGSTTLMVIVGLRLEIQRVDAGHSRIRWPGALVGAVLEQSADANGASGWTPVEAEPQLVGDRWEMVVPQALEPAFFRLVRR